jgi:hypothetical protein
MDRYRENVGWEVSPLPVDFQLFVIVIDWDLLELVKQFAGWDSDLQINSFGVVVGGSFDVSIGFLVLFVPCACGMKTSAASPTSGYERSKYSDTSDWIRSVIVKFCGFTFLDSE